MDNINLSYSPAELKEYIIAHNQDTGDIIEAILKADETNPKMSYDNAVLFISDDDYKTGLNIFNYIKDNIYYEAEPDSQQTTKTIERILTDKKGDCKHYSLFAGSILKTLGIPYAYRFVSFDGKDLAHVYIIINPDTNPIYLDGVIDEYNTQETYKYYEDYYPKKNNQKLNTIGATDPAGVYLEDVGTFHSLEPGMKFFVQLGLDKPEGVHYLSSDYVNWAEAVILTFRQNFSLYVIEKKKGQHWVNRWIEGAHITARVIAKKRITNDQYKRDALGAMWLTKQLCYYNQDLYNELFSDYKLDFVHILAEWENIRRMWYNQGGDYEESASKSLQGLIIEYVEDNVTNHKSIYQLTREDVEPYLMANLNLNNVEAIAEIDVESIEEEGIINGAQVGEVATWVTVVVTLIGIIVSIIIACLNNSLAKDSLEFQQQVYADQQEEQDRYLEYVASLDTESLELSVDENGFLPAFNDPLALAAIAFGAVLIFEKDLK